MARIRQQKRPYSPEPEVSRATTNNKKKKTSHKSKHKKTVEPAVQIEVLDYSKIKSTPEYYEAKRAKKSKTKLMSKFSSKSDSSKSSKSTKSKSSKSKNAPGIDAPIPEESVLEASAVLAGFHTATSGWHTKTVAGKDGTPVKRKVRNKENGSIKKLAAIKEPKMSSKVLAVPRTTEFPLREFSLDTDPISKFDDNFRCFAVNENGERCTRKKVSMGLCKGHGGGKKCSEPGCTVSARSPTDKCNNHGGGNRCLAQGCGKSATGASYWCIKHGGGRRCKDPSCNKSARGVTEYCALHGGGNKCVVEGCNVAATQFRDVCKKHDGLSACSLMGCGMRAARPQTVDGQPFCVQHGGQLKCSVETCSVQARAGTDTCKAHDPSTRCALSGCMFAAHPGSEMCTAHIGKKAVCKRAGCYGEPMQGRIRCVLHAGAARKYGPVKKAPKSSVKPRTKLVNASATSATIGKKRKYTKRKVVLGGAASASYAPSISRGFSSTGGCGGGPDDPDCGGDCGDCWGGFVRGSRVNASYVGCGGKPGDPDCGFDCADCGPVVFSAPVPKYEDVTVAAVMTGMIDQLDDSHSIIVGVMAGMLDQLEIASKTAAAPSRATVSTDASMSNAWDSYLTAARNHKMNVEVNMAVADVIAGMLDQVSDVDMDVVAPVSLTSAALITAPASSEVADVALFHPDSESIIKPKRKKRKMVEVTNVRSCVSAYGSGVARAARVTACANGAIAGECEEDVDVVVSSAGRASGFSRTARSHATDNGVLIPPGLSTSPQNDDAYPMTSVAGGARWVSAFTPAVDVNAQKKKGPFKVKTCLNRGCVHVIEESGKQCGSKHVVMDYKCWIHAKASAEPINILSHRILDDGNVVLTVHRAQVLPDERRSWTMEPLVRFLKEHPHIVFTYMHTRRTDEYHWLVLENVVRDQSNEDAEYAV